MTLVGLLFLPRIASAQLDITADKSSYIGNYNISCHGMSDGVIKLTVEGGVPPLAYLWNTTATTQDLFDIPAGNYSCIVIDSLGVSDTMFITLLEPNEMEIIFMPTSPSCHGRTDGQLQTEVQGGTPSYSYLWSNSTTESQLSDIHAGTYSLTVTDANECTVSGNYTLTQPTELSITLTSPVNANGFNVNAGEENGSIDLTATGGTPEYQYLWSNGSISEDMVNRLAAGHYEVKVTDQNNCSKIDSINLTSEDSLLPGSIPMTTRGNWMNQTTDYIGTRNAAALVIKTNNTEQMRIASDGNVGIGTTNPIQKLDITGNIKLRGKLQIDSLAFTPDSNDIALDSAGTQFFRVLGVSSSGVIIAGPHPAFDPSEHCGDSPFGPDYGWHTSLDKSIISSCDVVTHDNVGIGTYSPQAKLHVVGKSYFDGNVGIGTVNPLAKLDVRGGFSVHGGSLVYLGNDNASPSYSSYFAAGRRGLMIDNGESTSWDFITCVNTLGTEPEKFKIKSDGTVYARKFKVMVEAFPDYVFEESYDKPTLEELDLFLSKNKHLPGIPSEKEITSNCLDLGEMQVLQMQKLEEIFLYLIELKKENTELKSLVKSCGIQTERQ